jgi:hypothetical protein
MERITNKTSRTKMGMKKDILQKIEEWELRWYGHIKQMEDYRIARQVAEWNLQGKRRCDRPVNTWKDRIRDSMQRRNPKDVECFDLEEKNYVFGLRKIVYLQNNYFNSSNISTMVVNEPLYIVLNVKCMIW